MTIVNSRRLTTVALTFAALLACLGAEASELVYTPVNPSFGGNPLNGSILLNEAQARNRTKEPAAVSASTPGSQSPLQQFNHMLERSVLSRLRQRTPKQRWADFSAHLFCPFRLYYLPEGPMIADANLQVWPDVQPHAG